VPGGGRRARSLAEDVHKGPLDRLTRATASDTRGPGAAVQAGCGFSVLLGTTRRLAALCVRRGSGAAQGTRRYMLPGSGPVVQSHPARVGASDRGRGLISAVASGPALVGPGAVTVPKDTLPNDPLMNTTDNGRAEARSRANRRLKRMTIGTALAAVAATGGFGWLAAATYNGASTDATTAAVTTKTTSAAADTAANSSTGASTSTSTGTTTTAPVVSAAQGVAHASTGGS